MIFYVFAVLLQVGHDERGRLRQVGQVRRMRNEGVHRHRQRAAGRYFRVLQVDGMRGPLRIYYFLDRQTFWRFVCVDVWSVGWFDVVVCNVLVDAVDVTFEVVSTAETLEANLTLKRPLAGVRSDVFGVVFPEKKIKKTFWELKFQVNSFYYLNLRF